MSCGSVWSRGGIVEFTKQLTIYSLTLESPQPLKEHRANLIRNQISKFSSWQHRRSEAASSMCREDNSTAMMLSFVLLAATLVCSDDSTQNGHRDIFDSNLSKGGNAASSTEDVVAKIHGWLMAFAVSDRAEWIKNETMLNENILHINRKDWFIPGPMNTTMNYPLFCPIKHICITGIFCFCSIFSNNTKQLHYSPC